MAIRESGSSAAWPTTRSPSHKPRRQSFDYTALPADLKKLTPERAVTAIRACRDSYFVTTADGRTRPFWDESLRFETDASPLGPLPGKPAILPVGMFGDRAAIIFARSGEIGSFIKEKC